MKTKHPFHLKIFLTLNLCGVLLSLFSLELLIGKSGNAMAAGPESNYSLQAVCSPVFSKSAVQWSKELRADNPKSIHLQAYRAYQKFLQKNAVFGNLLKPSAVLPLIMNEDEPIWSERFLLLIQKFRTSNPDLAEGQLKKLVIELFLKENEFWVPHGTAKTRAEKITSGDPNELSFALGRLTLEDHNKILYGEDFRKPSPQSAIGYLTKETNTQVGVRTFSKTNTANSTERGLERLVVQVSQNSWSLVEKLIINPQTSMIGRNMTTHLHDPGQGTLRVGFRGGTFTWGGGGQGLRMPRVGSTLPLIGLSTSESERMANFYRLFKINTGLGMIPWQIPSIPGSPFPRYCAQGGYTSCTHWWANLPIGDKRVTQYVFPGNVDNYAAGAAGPGPQTQPLMKTGKAGLTTRSDSRLLRQVWKTPGNQQFFELLNLYNQQVSGELANPGYVLLSLLGYAPVDRIPVVLFLVENHESPLPEVVDPGTRAY